MIQSTSCNGTPDGLHLAIIMDGNGRWAAARGLPRLAGHRRGADAVRRVVEAAPALVRDGVRLTVIGRRDRLPLDVLGAVIGVEAATAGGRRLRLRIAIDYSARDAILHAARGL